MPPRMLWWVLTVEIVRRQLKPLKLIQEASLRQHPQREIVPLGPERNLSDYTNRALAIDGVNCGAPLTGYFAARAESALAQPIGNDFDCGGRHGLFDIVVFVWTASLGVLQQSGSSLAIQ